MSVEDIWRAKSDEQLCIAARQLDEYTDAGRAAICAELQRRGLDRSGATIVEATDREVEEPATSQPPPRNPLAKLWRGRFSLPITFWIWGVLGNRILFATVTGILPETGSLILMFGGLVIYVAYFVIVTVAIWRSSRRYAGPRVWRDLARVSAGLGILRVIAEILVY